MAHPVKRGLGRGLSALLGDQGVPTSPSAADSLRDIPVAQIKPNPFQPRKVFDVATLDELKSSIAEYGVLVPIIVRKRGDGFELIAGERRWRACAALQRPTIPAIVRQSDDRETLEVAMIENLQRENLNPLEEAAGFAHLLDEYAFTQEQLAARLGKSRPAVANSLRLLALADGIKAMLVDGRLTAGHARALLAAPESVRARLADRAIAENMSVRALERLAGLATVAAPVVKNGVPPRSLTADEHAFEARLRTKFGAHVALRHSGKGGKIEIRFINEKDLLRIADLLIGEE
jgi:ParB family transcriptional regulator, chromosome partitioning protein